VDCPTKHLGLCNWSGKHGQHSTYYGLHHECPECHAYTSMGVREYECNKCYAVKGKQDVEKAKEQWRLA